MASGGGVEDEGGHGEGLPGLRQTDKLGDIFQVPRLDHESIG